MFLIIGYFFKHAKFVDGEEVCELFGSLYIYLFVYLIIGLYCLCQVAVAEVSVLVVAK